MSVLYPSATLRHQRAPDADRHPYRPSRIVDSIVDLVDVLG